MGSYYPVLWVLILQIVKRFLNRLTTAVKFWCSKSTVNQNVNDNNYSFDVFGTYTKTIGENHNFVGTIGNTIYKEWGGSFATGYDVPIMGLCRYSVNYRFCRSKNKWLLCIWRKKILVECNTITRKYLLSAMQDVMLPQNLDR
jgi:hypothetical protein